jgi:hypothetical protein
MSPADITRLRFELTCDRQQVDGCLGRASQLLDDFEATWREQQRNERLTVAERQSLGSAA